MSLTALVRKFLAISLFQQWWRDQPLLSHFLFLLILLEGMYTCIIQEVKCNFFFSIYANNRYLILGSNDRNCERNVNRDNGNRLFNR